MLGYHFLKWLTKDELLGRVYGYVAFLKFLPDPFSEENVVKHKVYTVYDSKAEVYMQPIYFRADGEALRAFKASVQSGGHQFANNPADYTLFGIGEYDDDKARFVQYDAFVNLGNGVQFTSSAKSEDNNS